MPEHTALYNNLLNIFLQIAYRGDYEKYYPTLKQVLGWENHINSAEEAKQWVDSCFFEHPIFPILIISFCLDTPFYEIPEGLTIGKRIKYCLRLDTTKAKSASRAYERALEKFTEMVSEDENLYDEKRYTKHLENGSILILRYGSIKMLDKKLHPEKHKKYDENDITTLAFNENQCLVIFEFLKDLRDNPDEIYERYNIDSIKKNADIIPALDVKDFDIYMKKMNYLIRAAMQIKESADKFAIDHFSKLHFWKALSDEEKDDYWNRIWEAKKEREKKLGF